METVNYGRNKFYDTGPWCFLQTLHKSGKACQGQTL